MPMDQCFLRPPVKAENKNNTQEGLGYIEEKVGNLQKVRTEGI